MKIFPIARCIRSIVHKVRQVFSKQVKFLEQLRTTPALVSMLEARSQRLEVLVETIEKRSQTLEFIARQSLCNADYQISQLHRFYVEAMPVLLGLSRREFFLATQVLELRTDYPIAMGSNDHIHPDSTSEGVSRPTLFVQNCISVLGKDILCLDLGVGAAGLVFEYAMNSVLAVGIDGSDFCRENRVGYWPLLNDNLFTCDITKPFSFVSRDGERQILFNVITMWEVLEHIAEIDLPTLLSNVCRHLDNSGYFIGSISMVEYADGEGNPYHVTIEPREWWQARFSENGLSILDVHPFQEKYFCRGNGQRFQDFHNYDQSPESGFHFVAEKALTSVFRQTP